MAVRGRRGWQPDASVALGLRHDGVDAETGTGVEVGAGIPLRGRGRHRRRIGRGLIMHEASGYEEWCASGAARIGPGASARGLSLTPDSA